MGTNNHRDFIRVLEEIFLEKEASSFSILNTYWVGLSWCAVFSTIYGFISIWFDGFQWESFASLVSIYFGWIFYKLLELKTYRNVFDFSIFYNNPNFTRVMGVSEQSLEIGLFSLKEKRFNLDKLTLLFLGIFSKIGPLPGIVALSIIVFKRGIQPWALTIAYANMWLLFLMKITNRYLIFLEYMISMTEFALKKKQEGN